MVGGFTFSCIGWVDLVWLWGSPSLMVGGCTLSSIILHFRIIGVKCTTILTMVMDMIYLMLMLKTTAHAAMAGEDGGIEV